MKNYLVAVCLLLAADVQAQSFLGLGGMFRGLRSDFSDFLGVATGRALRGHPSAGGVQRAQEADEALALLLGLSQQRTSPGVVEELAGRLENIASESNTDDWHKKNILKILERSSDSDDRWLAEEIKEGRYVFIPSDEISVAVARNGYGNDSDEIISFFDDKLPRRHAYYFGESRGRPFVLLTPEEYGSFKKLILGKKPRENLRELDREKRDIVRFLERSRYDEDKVIAKSIKKGRSIFIPSDEISVALRTNGYGDSYDEIGNFFERELSEHDYLPIEMKTKRGRKTFVLSTPEGYESFEKLILQKRRHLRLVRP